MQARTFLDSVEVDAVAILVGIISFISMSHAVTFFFKDTAILFFQAVTIDDI